MIKKISVVGLGNLGLCYATCLADSGFKVLGLDIKDELINSLNKGVTHSNEPGLQDLLSKVGKDFRATTNYAQTIRETDVTVILVSTPSDINGNFSNTYVEQVLRSLSLQLRKSVKPYHLFIISSTVMPTSTEKCFISTIEKNSGRVLNGGFGLCYIPDFVALGSVIRDFFYPDFVLIGESDKRAGNMAESMYRRLCKNKPPVHRMSIVNAEIAKVSLNCYITLKISFANLIGNICAVTPGADVDKVTSAIGCDKRISPYYLTGGLPFGGRCFPRDVKAFIAFARKVRVPASLVSAAVESNEKHYEFIVRVIQSEIERTQAKSLALVGVSFKEDTFHVDDSPALEIARRVLNRNKNKNITLYLYDSLQVLKNAERELGKTVHYISSNGKPKFASVWVFLTRSEKQYSALIRRVAVQKNGSVIDCWRAFESFFDKQSPALRYIGLGVFKSKN